MKTNRQKTIGKIKGTSYRNTSYYGNPSYFITFENSEGEEITGYSSPDSSGAYGCKNPDLREFAYIEYHATKGGKIVIDYICNKHIYHNNYRVTE